MLLFCLEELGIIGVVADEDEDEDGDLCLRAADIEAAAVEIARSFRLLKLRWSFLTKLNESKSGVV